MQATQFGTITLLCLRAIYFGVAYTIRLVRTGTSN